MYYILIFDLLILSITSNYFCDFLSYIIKFYFIYVPKSLTHNFSVAKLLYIILKIFYFKKKKNGAPTKNLCGMVFSHV